MPFKIGLIKADKKIEVTYADHWEHGAGEADSAAMRKRRRVLESCKDETSRTA